MNDLKLKIGCYQYDHTRALFDGTVKIDGIDTTFESAPIVSQIFQRMVQKHAFDVSELGLTYYLRTLDLEDPPFIALPWPLEEIGAERIMFSTDYPYLIVPKNGARDFIELSAIPDATKHLIANGNWQRLSAQVRN
jgi:hypothetical protein